MKHFLVSALGSRAFSHANRWTPYTPHSAWHHGLGGSIVRGAANSAAWHGIGALFRGVGPIAGLALAALVLLVVAVVVRR